MNLKQKLVEIRKHIGIQQKTAKGQNGQYVDPAKLLLRATDKMNELSVLLTSHVKKADLTKESNPTIKNADAKVFCVSLEMEMIFHDAETDETMSIPWFAFGKNATDPSMAGGSALTYFERYFIMKQFNIPTTKDDPEFLKEQVRGPEFLTDPQIAKISEMLAKISEIDPATTKEPFLAKMGVESIESIYSKNFNQAMVMLNAVLNGRLKSQKETIA